MIDPSRHRIFGQGLVGISTLLVLLVIPIHARAAISNGPNYTNSIDAEQQRILQFHAAEESFQEKLKVGRERYNQKQIYRARVIAAMASELQARQETVVIQPLVATVNNTDELVVWSGPSLAVTALALGIFGFGYRLRRQQAQKASGSSGVILGLKAAKTSTYKPANSPAG